MTDTATTLISREPLARSGRWLQMPALWVAVFSLGLMDAAWASAIGLTLSGYATFVAVSGGLLATALVLCGLRRCRQIALLAEVWALWMVLATVGNILTYLAATPGLPLQDKTLADLDTWLGFDWLGFYRFIQESPALHLVLTISYASLIPETFILAVFLSFAGLGQRLREFCGAIVICLLLTSALSALMPSAGAFEAYGLGDQADWSHDFNVLRDRSDLHFVLPDMVGVVGFPSFHTVVPLLIVHASRGTGLAGWLFLAWNLVMLVSILPLGGHYLADMAGGAVVAAVALPIRRVASRWCQAFGRRPLAE